MRISRVAPNPAPIMLVYGAEGRGKTTLAAKFPKPLFAAREHGIPAGVAVDNIEAADFKELMGSLREIYLADTFDYGSLTIDTVDHLEAELIAYVCQQHGWKNIEQPSYGKGYVAADDVWRKFIATITAIRNKHAVPVILIAHAEIVRIDDPRAPTYSSYAPRLHRRARALIMDCCDIVGFLAEDLRTVSEQGGFTERTRASASSRRYLFVEGSPAFSAKNRYGLPAKIEVPLDFDPKTILNLTKGQV